MPRTDGPESGRSCLSMSLLLLFWPLPRPHPMMQMKRRMGLWRWRGRWGRRARIRRHALRPKARVRNDWLPRSRLIALKNPAGGVWRVFGSMRTRTCMRCWLMWRRRSTAWAIIKLSRAMRLLSTRGLCSTLLPSHHQSQSGMVLPLSNYLSWIMSILVE